MNGSSLQIRSALHAMSLVAVGFMVEAAEPIRPVQVAQAEFAESQVDENPALQAPRWVIRHRTGLRVMDIRSGAVKDVVVYPKRSGEWTGTRFLTADAAVFAYESSDEGDLTIARVADGAAVVKVDAEKILELLGIPRSRVDSRYNLWGETWLANDASHLWLRDGARRIVRIDLTPEPRVAASRELEGSRTAAFNLFVSGDEPGLVVTTDLSPKGGWFRVFDHELRLLHSSKLPQCAPSCAVDGPEPLVLLQFPQTMTWQLLGSRGKDFRLVSSASYGRGRPGSHLAFRSLMAAAISPDGKLLVTSQFSKRPTISVWNPATGRLVREVELIGGMALHHTIHRLAFSLSGKYLTASDSGNAYLVEVADLVKDSTATKEQ